MAKAGTGQGLLVSEAGNRQQSRLSVLVPVIVTTAEGTRRGTLEDLSLRGARLIGSTGLCLDQQVVLQWHRFHALGQVRWIEDDVCGVGFFRSLPVRDLLETRELPPHVEAELDRDVVRRTADAFVQGRVKL